VAIVHIVDFSPVFLGAQFNSCIFLTSFEYAEFLVVCLNTACIILHTNKADTAQLDESGEEFMRPVSHASHHANNDNLAQKERKRMK
jgi:hypothetical protein